jgi:predicted RNase H-like nuclease (RuvC/YqgF family)
MKWTGFVLGGLLLLPEQGTAELRPLQDRGQQKMNNVATERPGTETRYVPTGREPTNEREPFFAGSTPQELLEKISFLERKIQQMERTAPALENRVQELERSAPALENRVQELERSAPALENRVHELERSAPALENRVQELERSAPFTKEGNLQILTRSGVRLESFGGNVVVQVPETLTFKAKKVIMPNER